MRQRRGSKEGMTGGMWRDGRYLGEKREVMSESGCRDVENDPANKKNERTSILYPSLASH